MLDAERSHYLGRVLRLKPESELRLFNRDGVEYDGSIITLEKRSATIRIGATIANDSLSPLQIELGIGLSRGERFDWVVQKATELGVNVISPLLTERTEVKLNQERSLKRVQHWEKVAISACEQSGRHTLPLIHSPTPIDNWLTRAEADVKLILDPYANPHSTGSDSVTSAALLVGPEGGFSKVEVERATTCGFQALALGPRVLRTETAPIAGITLAQHLWGDM